MIRAAIIDNEPHIVSGIQKLLAMYCRGVQVIETANSVESALKLLSTIKIDLIFLDIELDDGTGFDILKMHRPIDFGVIFVTAYDNYAIDAFKMSAIDYLLKPIDSDDLISAVEKAKSRRNNFKNEIRYDSLLQNVNTEYSKEKRLVISDATSVYALSLDDILYLEAQGAYTKFVLRDKQILASNNLKSYEEILANKHFVRAHHSYLVNIFEITEFNRSDSKVILTNDERISVSVRKKDQVIKAIKQLSI